MCGWRTGNSLDFKEKAIEMAGQMMRRRALFAGCLLSCAVWGAPTGRAARVLQNRMGCGAKTIRSTNYDYQGESIWGNELEDNGEV